MPEPQLVSTPHSNIWHKLAMWDIYTDLEESQLLIREHGTVRRTLRKSMSCVKRSFEHSLVE